MELENRVAALEARLAALETFLSASRRISQPRAPEPAAPPVHVEVRPQPYTAPSRTSPYAAQVRTSPPFSGNWLGILAVICFVLAAAFIVKLSIESGWLTPSRQIVLAALLGFSLIAAGFALRRADHGYASLLPGAGVVILYLTSFTAHSLYHLIAFDSALVITSLVSAGCIWLYSELRHDLYAFIAGVGAYLAPVIMGLEGDPVFSLYYFVLCSAAFAAISVWVKSRAPTIVASYLAILVSAIIGIALKDNLFVAAILASHFVIFAAGSLLYSARNNALLSFREAVAFLPVLLIFYAAEYFFIARIDDDLAAWAAMGFAGLLVAMYLFVKQRFAESDNSQALLLALTTIILFHAGYLELMPEALRPYLLAAMLFAAAAMPSYQPRLSYTHPFALPALALLAIMVIEYSTMMGSMWAHAARPDPAAYLAIAAFWTLIARGGGHAQLHITPYLLGAVNMLAMLTFYRAAIPVSSLAVSAAWLLYGASVIGFAYVRRDEFMAKSALVVLALAAAKALLVDAASAPTIVRILCLLLTGAVLYGCGFLLRQFNRWSRADAST